MTKQNQQLPLWLSTPPNPNDPKIQKAKKADMTPTIFDPAEQCAEFSSKHGYYWTTLEGCRTKDAPCGGGFPCKHMYRLAMMLGLIHEEYINDPTKIKRVRTGIPLAQAVDRLETVSEAAQKELLLNILILRNTYITAKEISEGLSDELCNAKILDRIDEPQGYILHPDLSLPSFKLYKYLRRKYEFCSEFINKDGETIGIPAHAIARVDETGRVLEYHFPNDDVAGQLKAHGFDRCSGLVSPDDDIYSLFTVNSEGEESTMQNDNIQSEVTDSKSEILGCCSLYRECSAAGHCIQTEAYYKQCAYRKNLEQGNIFYSKNASDFSQQKYDYIVDFRRSLGEQERSTFDWTIIYFRQTMRGCNSCLCLADSVLENIVNKFEGFTLRSPISLTRRLFDDKLLSTKTAVQLHAAYSKLPAPDMIPYPPLPKDTTQDAKKERDKKVDEIRAKNLKAWIEHFEKDSDLLQVISSHFMYFDFTDYHPELEEFYLDNRSSLSRQLPDIVVYNSSTAKTFKDAIEALG